MSAPTYKYLGDRLTDPSLKGALCTAVRRANGKCIRGKNGTMLVQFETEKHIVIGRLLRKTVMASHENDGLNPERIAQELIKDGWTADRYENGVQAERVKRLAFWIKNDAPKVIIENEERIIQYGEQVINFMKKA